MSAPLTTRLPQAAQLLPEFHELLETISGIRPQPRRFLEIGVHQGGTLARFHERFPEAIVVGIDPEPFGIEGDGTMFGCPVVTGFSQDVRVQTRALELLSGERRGVYMAPDVVHVDGGHRLREVWADLLWAMELRPRLIALHDVTCRVHPQIEVWRAWDALREATPEGWLASEIRFSPSDYGYGILTRAD